MKKNSQYYKCLLTSLVLCLLFASNIKDVKAQSVITPSTGSQTTVDDTSHTEPVITTTNAAGNLAINTFDNFQVYTDLSHVDFEFPSGASLLVNRVVGPSPAYIDTVVNAVTTNPQGGTMMFAAPSGIVVGANGIINAGAIVLTTASQIIFRDADGSTTRDLMNDSLLSGFTGVDPAFNFRTYQVSGAGSIVVNGVINVNGVDTFNGGPPAVILDSINVQIGPTAQILGRDGNTLNDVPDARITVAAAGQLQYDLPSGYAESPVPVDFGGVVNVGQVTNAGIIRATEGEVRVIAAASESLSGGIAQVVNTGSIITDADPSTTNRPGGMIDIFTMDDPALASRLGNTFIQNDGLISARSTISNPMLTGEGIVNLQSDNINTSVGSLINVTGQNATDKSGFISVRPSPQGLNDQVQVGLDAPGANTLHIDNDFFQRVDNTFTVNPVTVLVESPFGNMTVSNLTVPTNLMTDLVVSEASSGLSVNSQINTESTLNLSAESNIHLMADINANFNAGPDNKRYVRLSADTIQFDSAGNSDINIQTAVGNFPLMMRANSVTQMDVPGNDIVNYNAGTGAGGIFVFDPFTFNQIELNGNDILVGGTPVIDLNEIDLGTSGGVLALGNPADITLYDNFITVTNLPVNSMFDDGAIALYTDINSPGSAVTVSNCDFESRNIDFIVQAPFVDPAENIDLNTNNNFGLLELHTTGIVNVQDQAGGMTIDQSPKFLTPGIPLIHNLQLSTPALYTGNIAINGDIMMLSVLNNGTGGININNAHIVNTTLFDIQANDGDVNINLNAGFDLLGGSNVSGNNVMIANTGTNNGDYNIQGVIEGNTDTVFIDQNNSLSSVNIADSGQVNLNGGANVNSIAIESENQINIAGQILLRGNSVLNSFGNEVSLEAPVISFDTLNPPDISVQTTLGNATPVLSLRVDQINNGAFAFGSPVISIYHQLSFDGGALAVKPFSNNDVMVTDTGIDIGNNGQDLLFENTYIGNNAATLIVGEPGPLDPAFVSPGVVGDVIVDGLPQNTMNSFQNANFLFTSQSVSATTPVIEIRNADFLNSDVFLNAPNASLNGGIDALTNVNFNELTVMTPGRVRINDNNGDLNLNDVNFAGINYISTAETLEVVGNGNVAINGVFTDVNAQIMTPGDLSINSQQAPLNILNASAPDGNVQITNDNAISIVDGAFVGANEVLIRNITDIVTGIPVGIIDIQGNVTSQDGNINIESAFGYIIFNSTSQVEANATAQPDSGNVIIHRIDSVGDLQMDFVDGFTFNTNPIPLTNNGYLEVEGTLLINNVIITGSQTGPLAVNSPYSNDEVYIGTAGNVNVDRTIIEVRAGVLPDPVVDPDDPVVDPDNPVIDPAVIVNEEDVLWQEDNFFDPQNESLEEFLNEDDDWQLIQDENEIFVFDPDSGESVSIVNDDSTGNVLLLDMTDNQQEDGNLIFNDNVILLESMDPLGMEFTGTEDSIVFDLFDSESGDSIDSLSDDSIASSFADSLDEESSSKSKNGPPRPMNTNESEANENLQVAKVSGKSIINQLSDDSVMDIANTDAMTAMFNICQGTFSCKGIATKANYEIMMQSIFINNQQNELQADHYGTKFLTQTGYHPAGLQGFLMTLNNIEKYIEKNSVNKPDIKPVFSYRHPKTSERLDLVKSFIKESKLLKVKKKIVNKNIYKKMKEGLK